MEQLPYAPEEIAKIRGWYVKNGTQKFLNVPVIIDDRSIGGLVIFFPAHRQFSESQIEFGLAIARLVGLAIVVSRQAEIEKQTAIAREQEKAAQVRVVQIARANATLKQTLDVLATEPKLELSLGHVLKVTSAQLNSSSSALWFYDPLADTFVIHTVYLDGNIVPATPENAPLLSGKWIRGQNLSADLLLKKHIRDRIPVIYQVDDYPEIPAPMRRHMQRLGIKTLLGIPLLLGSEIIGSFTIRFDQKRLLEPDELELTQALAHQATLAIQLLKRAEQAKQAALYVERNRLAGEIHDTLAQSFTSISIQTGVARWMLQQDPTAIESILNRINDIAQSGLSEARRSVWEIYPTAQEYSNLIDKLSQSVDRLTCDACIQVSVQIIGTPFEVSPIVGYNLLKLTQEAITNSLKHADANTLSIILTYSDRTVSLSIIDDGRGFQLEGESGGFGLLSMSERTDRLGGKFAINSSLGLGTEIRVEVPIKLKV
ncbi:GAF domain-containing sensor histidine kinase [Synechococcus sp. PCC 7502]|uniref:GAF domain-containing sensor histidine kinase n=1 Tax=Synechococcus sp. PCC 7502 TaxID=1173263 RepID=UPI001AEFABFE|nr:GAF domain-containing sensor histidine kinase [Synechococcus sp. PCC 7502]